MTARRKRGGGKAGKKNKLGRKKTAEPPRVGHCLEHQEEKNRIKSGKRCELIMTVAGL